jgi:hypothetical protein
MPSVPRHKAAQQAMEAGQPEMGYGGRHPGPRPEDQEERKKEEGEGGQAVEARTERSHCGTRLQPHRGEKREQTRDLKTGLRRTS